MQRLTGLQCVHFSPLLLRPLHFTNAGYSAQKLRIPQSCRFLRMMNERTDSSSSECRGKSTTSITRTTAPPPPKTTAAGAGRGAIGRRATAPPPRPPAASRWPRKRTRVSRSVGIWDRTLRFWSFQYSINPALSRQGVKTLSHLLQSRLLQFDVTRAAQAGGCDIELQQTGHLLQLSGEDFDPLSGLPV